LRGDIFPDKPVNPVSLLALLATLEPLDEDFPPLPERPLVPREELFSEDLPPSDGR
jgi:hypothetical protein